MTNEVRINELKDKLVKLQAEIGKMEIERNLGTAYHSIPELDAKKKLYGKLSREYMKLKRPDLMCKII